MEQKEKQSELGIAGMILGIVAVVFSIIMIGGLIGIVGFILSLIGISPKNKKTGAATAGFVLNIIAIIIGLFIALAVFFPPQDDTETQHDTSIQNEITLSTPKPSLEPTATPTPEPTPKPTPTPEPILSCIVDRCRVEFLEYELIEDREGNECIVIYYAFKNASDENKSFGYVVDDKAFQNGIELEPSIWDVEGAEENKYLEIKPGVVITVYSSFILRDDSDVEIEISELFSFDNEIIDSMVLSLE